MGNTDDNNVGNAIYIYSGAPGDALTLINMVDVQSDPVGESPSKVTSCSSKPSVCTDAGYDDGTICSDVAITPARIACNKPQDCVNTDGTTANVNDCTCGSFFLCSVGR